MQVEAKFTGKLQKAMSEGVLKRLPLTFLPFVNQQLSQWEYLFPNERQSVERLLLFVTDLTPEESTDLFRDTVQLEDKMGVGKWQFSTKEQTIENSSELARSPYFQEWRKAVQAVFDAADKHALQASSATEKSGKRLVLIDIPKPLSIDPAQPWRRWQGIGRPLKLDPTYTGTALSPFDLLLNGMPDATGARTGGILDVARRRSGSFPADTWVVDAGRSLVDSSLDRINATKTAPDAILLSYGRLDQYRQNFSHEMNTMHKDLTDADAVFDHLRKVEVTPWCPAEVAADATVREFVRSLYLSGNGAVIFGNSFVQWAASEAFRRARPSFLAAQFGVRSKPKPFTGVAVFDNPDQVNPLPAVDDLPGSAMDAQMLALYVWLAASRYNEYQHATACVCLVESLAEAYVVAPPEFSLLQQKEPVHIEQLGDALRAWLS